MGISVERPKVQRAHFRLAITISNFSFIERDGKDKKCLVYCF